MESVCSREAGGSWESIEPVAARLEGIQISPSHLYVPSCISFIDSHCKLHFYLYLYPLWKIAPKASEIVQYPATYIGDGINSLKSKTQISGEEVYGSILRHVPVMTS